MTYKYVDGYQLNVHITETKYPSAFSMLEFQKSLHYVVDVAWTVILLLKYRAIGTLKSLPRGPLKRICSQLLKMN